MNEAIVLLLAPLAAAVGGVWSLVATLTWRGTPRLLAAVPLAAVAAYVAFVIAPDVLADPSSHNLLPFELGVLFWPALPYMVVLVLATRRSRAERAADGPDRA